MHGLRASPLSRAGEHYSLLLLAPGWIKADLDGPMATFTIGQVISDIVGMIVVQE